MAGQTPDKSELQVIRLGRAWDMYGVEITEGHAMWPELEQMRALQEKLAKRAGILSRDKDSGEPLAISCKLYKGRKP